MAIRNESGIRSLGPDHFFYINGAYLLLLVLTLPAWHADWFHVKSAFPGGLFLHQVPVGVLWFGALGGITISLYGVFDHNGHWGVKWNHWHLARPFMGMIMATVGMLLFSVLAESATGGQPETKPRGVVVYWVLAFVLGYREESFRTLLKRFVDLFLAPPPGEGGTLVAALVAQPSAAKVGRDVTFDVSAASVPDPAQATWTLDFGDGTAAVNGTGRPDNQKHPYATAGSYDAQLKITTTSGVTATATARVNVVA